MVIVSSGMCKSIVSRGDSVGDEVVLGALNDDPAQLVILGSLYFEHNKPAFAADAANSIKAISTKSRLKIEFDDDTKSITITTPGQNPFVLSDDTKSVALSDQNGNCVTLDATGVTLTSQHDRTLSCKGKMKIDSAQSIATTGARLGDSTAHGGSIVLGLPTVMIGG